MILMLFPTSLALRLELFVVVSVCSPKEPLVSMIAVNARVLGPAERHGEYAKATRIVMERAKIGAEKMSGHSTERNKKALYT